jgi:Domain of unknown function (DUF1854)
MSSNNGECPYRLGEDGAGRLVLTGPDGLEVVGVEPVRAFPLSAPRRGISLTDPTGAEVLWVADLDELPPEMRAPLEQRLARYEFVPTILRVLSVSAAVEPSEWEVETDRGLARFSLQSEDDVHALSESRALITDAHGVRYLIPDIRQLDAGSRRWLERFL